MYLEAGVMCNDILGWRMGDGQLFVNIKFKLKNEIKQIFLFELFCTLVCCLWKLSSCQRKSDLNIFVACGVGKVLYGVWVR